MLAYLFSLFAACEMRCNQIARLTLPCPELSAEMVEREKITSTLQRTCRGLLQETWTRYSERWRCAYNMFVTLQVLLCLSGWKDKWVCAWWAEVPNTMNKIKFYRIGFRVGIHLILYSTFASVLWNQLFLCRRLWPIGRSARIVFGFYFN